MPKTRSVPLAQHVWYRFAESVPHSREVELAPRRGTLTAVEPELRGVGWIVFLAGFFVGMTPVRCRCGASASTTTTSRPPPPAPEAEAEAEEILTALNIPLTALNIPTGHQNCATRTKTPRWSRLSHVPGVNR